MKLPVLCKSCNGSLQPLADNEIRSLKYVDVQLDLGTGPILNQKSRLMNCAEKTTNILMTMRVVGLKTSISKASPDRGNFDTSK